jgi:hypothetical protein
MLEMRTKNRIDFHVCCQKYFSNFVRIGMHRQIFSENTQYRNLGKSFQQLLFHGYRPSYGRTEEWSDFIRRTADLRMSLKSVDLE